MRKLLIITALLFSFLHVFSQRFEDYFEDRTLRLDYTFAGCEVIHQIFVDELVSLPRWYGRRERLAELPLRGNGQITVHSKKDSTIIYRHAFSTLFQEWLATDEAKHTQKSFENVFLVPFPKDSVEIKVELFDNHNEVVNSLTHTVDPKDILIRKAGEHAASALPSWPRAIPPMKWTIISATAKRPSVRFSTTSHSNRCRTASRLSPSSRHR